MQEFFKADRQISPLRAGAQRPGQPTRLRISDRSAVEMHRETLLPTPYFHIVFTLPRELRDPVRSHQKILLNALCRAAAYSLMKLAGDPHYFGGKIGILSVVHTWTRAMIYHPHVHCLVPGGGLSAAGWILARKDFFVQVTAVSRIFRARFIELAKEALPDMGFPDALG